VPAGEVWDGRWTTGPAQPGVTVGALGEAALADIPDWRETGLPAAALAATPAFRDAAGGLIAAPFAIPAKPCHSGLIGGPESFQAGLSRR
jgi:tRNA(Ile)-lysidine synthase